MKEIHRNDEKKSAGEDQTASFHILPNSQPTVISLEFSIYIIQAQLKTDHLIARIVLLKVNNRLLYQVRHCTIPFKWTQLYGSKEGQLAGSCEHGNEPCGSIKCMTFLDWLASLIRSIMYVYWSLIKNSNQMQYSVYSATVYRILYTVPLYICLKIITPLCLLNQLSSMKTA